MAERGVIKESVRQEREGDPLQAKEGDSAIVGMISKLQLSDTTSATPPATPNVDSPSTSNASQTELQCVICQDTALHPIRLPCGHVFCYLCIKGVFARQGTCALCRQPIPASAINKPTMKSDSSSSSSSTTAPQWLYEARGGDWWLYDERVSAEIEHGYTQDKRGSVKVNVSGYSYMVDYDKMVQYRTDRPERCRRVKRRTAEDTVKGVAGIPYSSRQDH